MCVSSRVSGALEQSVANADADMCVDVSCVCVCWCCCSIMVGPAPHLNGHYTIFGEAVDGFEVRKGRAAQPIQA